MLENEKKKMLFFMPIVQYFYFQLPFNFTRYVFGTLNNLF